MCFWLVVFYSVPRFCRPNSLWKAPTSLPYPGASWAVTAAWKALPQTAGPPGRIWKETSSYTPETHTWCYNKHVMSLKELLHYISVGAGLTALLWWLLQVAPGNQVGDLIVLRCQHWHHLGDVLRDPRRVLSQGGPNTCPLRKTV